MKSIQFINTKEIDTYLILNGTICQSYWRSTWSHIFQWFVAKSARRMLNYNKFSSNLDNSSLKVIISSSFEQPVKAEYMLIMFKRASFVVQLFDCVGFVGQYYLLYLWDLLTSQLSSEDFHSRTSMLGHLSTSSYFNGTLRMVSFNNFVWSTLKCGFPDMVKLKLIL